MTITANYLGMPLDISGLDTENLEYFRHCAAHAFHLQACSACNLIRYPPTTACPWCASPDARWVPVDGRGTVHSYTEVHHAIQPGFKDWTPYAIVLVELDEQRGTPTPDEALRIIGNLVTADFAPEPESKVAIGKRVRVVFQDLAGDFALPQFTLTDEPPVGRVWSLPA